MSNLSPIVLFVFNRPLITFQTLQALSNNYLSDRSRLYIYADGPKNDASADDFQKIKEVRRIIRQQKWCQEVEIIEHDENLGLSRSIVRGITNTVDRYGKVIVLEDDIVTSKGFLRYMNEALDLYEKSAEVMVISGYVFPGLKKLDDIFLIKGGTCPWGWATWKRAWNNYNNSSENLIKQIEMSDELEKFNMDGHYDYLGLLKADLNDAVDSWAVRWYTSVFLKGGLGLWPNRSLVQNIGHDNSGVHSGSTQNYMHLKLASSIPVKKIDIEHSEKSFQQIVSFYKRISTSKGKNRFLTKLKKKLKS